MAGTPSRPTAEVDSNIREMVGEHEKIGRLRYEQGERDEVDGCRAQVRCPTTTLLFILHQGRFQSWLIVEPGYFLFENRIRE